MSKSLLVKIGFYIKVEKSINLFHIFKRGSVYLD